LESLKKHNEPLPEVVEKMVSIWLKFLRPLVKKL
jgi:hypothetical protein